MPQERIDKLIASQGALSRSDVRRLVKSGAIALNGSPVRDAGQKCRSRSGSKSLFPAGLFLFPNIFISCSINPQASCPRAGMQTKNP